MFSENSPGVGALEQTDASTNASPTLNTLNPMVFLWSPVEKGRQKWSWP